jgi:hypothetical protein
MSESGDTSKLIKEIWPDTESDEEKGDSPIKINIKDKNPSLENSDSESKSEEYALVPKTKPKTKPKKKQKIIISSPADLNKEIISIEDVMNEYYKLKEKFENEMTTYKKKIINNNNLSNREKRSEFLKLMPKCVNCKRPSKKGTIFSITYHPADDKIPEHRVFKAICGNLADPCNLHIELNIGIQRPIDEELNIVTNEIKESKKSIINVKNKLLFGLITTETAIEYFDDNKKYINELTVFYENYLDLLNKAIDNPDEKAELDEALVQSYKSINDIKDCIKKMNNNNDVQFAKEAATIYHRNLQPLLNKIRHLKYRVNEVFNDDDDNCRLIQQKYIVDDIIGSEYDSKIVAYDVGLKSMVGKNKKTGLMSGGSDKVNESKLEKELTIKINDPDEVTEIIDEPIIGQGKDGILWNNPEYQKLWSKLPEKLKTEFKSNIDWMQMFMKKCVNEMIKHGSQWDGCKLPVPPNLVIPPRQMTNEQYDFGVSIYNKTFNRQPKTLQDTYLTFYSENPQTKEKDYSKFINAVHSLVENEVNFVSGFF